MIIGKNMKILRLESGMLQRDIALKLNISESTYSHFESGDAIITIKRLNDFCNYYKVSIDYILGITSERFYDDISYNIDKVKFGVRFKEFRKENKLTQKYLAEKLNIGLSVISGYEIGRYIISTQILYDVCTKYKISADYLLGKIDNPKYLK